MTETTTPNKSFYQVVVGTDKDTWGPLVNQNTSLYDSALGGVATIALTNVPVVLSSAQYACNFLTFTGSTLTD